MTLYLAIQELLGLLDHFPAQTHAIDLRFNETHRFSLRISYTAYPALLKAQLGTNQDDIEITHFFFQLKYRYRLHDRPLWGSFKHFGHQQAGGHAASANKQYFH